MSEFDDDRLDWEMLDPLVFSGEKLEFVMKVREATGAGLKEAQELLVRRYDFLRTSRPTGFSQSHTDYWTGFHS
jgi:hypothetical protein